MVAQITKNGKLFYVTCTKGEWESKPEVNFKLFRVIEITRLENNSDFWFEAQTSQGVLPLFRCNAGKWWKYSSEEAVTLRVALTEKTDEVFYIGASPNGNRFELVINHEELSAQKPESKAPRQTIQAEEIKSRRSKPLSQPMPLPVNVRQRPKPENGNDHNLSDEEKQALAEAQLDGGESKRARIN